MIQQLGLDYSTLHSVSSGLSATPAGYRHLPLVARLMSNIMASKRLHYSHYSTTIPAYSAAAGRQTISMMSLRRENNSNFQGIDRCQTVFMLMCVFNRHKKSSY